MAFIAMIPFILAYFVVVMIILAIIELIGITIIIVSLIRRHIFKKKGKKPKKFGLITGCVIASGPILFMLYLMIGAG